jgi:hypothetical protein
MEDFELQTTTIVFSPEVRINRYLELDRHLNQFGTLYRDFKHAFRKFPFL